MSPGPDLREKTAPRRTRGSPPRVEAPRSGHGSAKITWNAIRYVERGGGGGREAADPQAWREGVRRMDKRVGRAGVERRSLFVIEGSVAIRRTFRATA